MPRRRVCAWEKGTVSVAVILSLSLVVWARAENWPRFRGPNGQGISEDKGIPVQWSPGGYAWKIELPGGGHSSPVVWGDKVFITCADGQTLRGVLLCVNAANGRELWRKEYRLNKLPMNGLNNYAAATPALDAEQVYVFWPDKEQPTLAALAHDGREIWTAKLPGIYARHGVGSSPIVCGEHVIITREQDKGSGDAAGVWLALARQTGQVQWRYEHPQNTNASYSTPCLYRDSQGRNQLIFTSNSYGIAAVDPETGGLLWKTPDSLPARVVSSPVLAGDTIIATCGEGGGGVRLAAVQPPEGSSSSVAKELYGLECGVVPYVPTSVVRDGLLFGFHDGGKVSCFRVGTGEVLWTEKPAGRYFGSPVWVEGKLYCITTEGDVVVLRAGLKYELLAVNPLGEKSHATPAVANGRMYLRTYSHLFCLGGKE
jgi:outer membrane protein assembly factor BamB